MIRFIDMKYPCDVVYQWPMIFFVTLSARFKRKAGIKLISETNLMAEPLFAISTFGVEFLYYSQLIHPISLKLHVSDILIHKAHIQNIFGDQM